MAAVVDRRLAGLLSRATAMGAEALMSRLRRTGLIAAVFLALFIPQVTNPSFSFKLALGGSFAVTMLSLVVLLGFLGQISLAQVSLMAVGAYTAAHLTGHHGWPLLLALPASGLMAVPVGAVVGLFAVRLRGIYLAIATLSFALAFDNVVPDIHVISGGQDGVSTPRPSIGGLSFGGDRAMWYLTALVFGLLALLVANVRRGRTGRAFAAIRDNEVAAAANGLSVTRYKLQGFTLAAFIAGVGGGLYAYTVGSPSPVDLDWSASVQLVILAVVVGVSLISGAGLAGFLYYVALPLWVLPVMDWVRVHLLPFLSHSGERMIPLLFGLVLIPQLIFFPQGIAAKVADDIRHLVGRVTGAAAPPPPMSAPPPTIDADIAAADLAGVAEPLSAGSEAAAGATAERRR